MIDELRGLMMTRPDLAIQKLFEMGAKVVEMHEEMRVDASHSYTIRIRLNDLDMFSHMYGPRDLVEEPKKEPEDLTDNELMYRIKDKLARKQ